MAPAVRARRSDRRDRPVVRRRHGQQLDLRWVLIHLIEECARHLGHLDLLREAVDSRTGC
ncbi:DUF664 domain-containing protein [Arsenicicoccus dermatophilus]|uniref:mycothiol transferase n=1 Tax=Arsenicicoccus dermatophilus TaxID=1076331 RepID=UPI003916E607